MVGDLWMRSYGCFVKLEATAERGATNFTIEDETSTAVPREGGALSRLPNFVSAPESQR
jgi:hypothetical protein